MEDFLTEILVHTKKVAFEAVEVISANKNLTSELQKANQHINEFQIRISRLTSNGHEADLVVTM